MNSNIQIETVSCIGCGLCVRECGHKAIQLKDGKAVPVSEHCMECGHCIAVCPKGAVWLNGYDRTEIVDVSLENSISPDVFLANVKTRRSIRHFKPDAVSHDDLKKVIEAGRFTPTGSNKQKNRYIVVENPTDSIEPNAIAVFRKLKSVADVVGRFIKLPINTREYTVDAGFFFHHAPAVILVISEDEVDAALASANMEMMAESMGYGILYIGFYARAVRFSRKIQKQLGLRKKEKMVTALAIGKPDVHFARSAPRKEPNIQWM